MSIQEHLNKIRNAIKGSEVRESIAKGIETAYDDASENGNANMEVRLARGTNPNLNTRLNEMEETDRQNTEKIDSNHNEVTAQLAQKADDLDLADAKDYINAMNLRVDNLVIPVTPDNTNVEVTDAHVSVAKNKSFDTIGNRFESVERHSKQIERAITSDYFYVTEWEKGSLDNEGNQRATNVRVVSDFIKVKEGMTVSTADPQLVGVYIAMYSEGKNYKGNLPYLDTRTISEDGYIRVATGYTDDRNIDDVRYFYDKVIININNLSHLNRRMTSLEEGQLLETREINGVRNDFRFNEDSQSWEVTKKIDIAHLDGSLNWSNFSAYTLDVGEVYAVRINGWNEVHNILSGVNDIGLAGNDISAFEVKRGGSHLTIPNGIIPLANGDLQIVVEKSYIDQYYTPNLGGMMAYLNDHPITFSFQMKEPKMIQLDKLSTTSKGLLEVSQKMEDLEKNKSYSMKITHINPIKNSIKDSETGSPVLIAIKQTNINNVANPNSNEPTQPYPLGYLFREKWLGSQKLFYYSDGNFHDAVEEIAWDYDLAGADVKEYQAFITKDGDIIFVWRGRNKSTEDSRRNPIVYPSDDYSNPVIVDLGDGIKPTAWLQNCGADYNYNEDYMMFGEYTLSSRHDKTYVWKVTKPFTEPSSWEIIMEKNCSDSIGNDDYVNHFHTANLDPFSGAWLVTTGDLSSSCLNYISLDHGETFTKVDGGSQINRALNYIFTEDYVYWGNDWLDSTHGLYRIDRDEGGIPDFSSRVKLAPLPRGQSTYVTCYLREPHGLLMLDRNDTGSTVPDYISVNFWSFNDEELHEVGRLEPLDGVENLFGFRALATSYYQGMIDNRIIVGFDWYRNEMKMLTNTSKNQLYTIALEIY